jgi:hypothetical protein
VPARRSRMGFVFGARCWTGHILSGGMRHSSWRIGVLEVLGWKLAAFIRQGALEQAL